MNENIKQGQELPEVTAATAEMLAELENGKGGDDNEQQPVG